MGHRIRSIPPLLPLAALLALCPIWITGCANAEHFRGLDLATTRPSSLIALPTAAQTGGKDDCGYAAMASVAMYHHVPASQLVNGSIPQKFNGPRLSGADLVQMATALGLTAFGYHGSLDDLRTNVDKGRPVLVLLAQPPRVAHYPELEFFGDVAAAPFVIPHWVVVVGFTADDRVVLHDPRAGAISMAQRDFVPLWERRSRLSVLVTKQ